MLAGAPKNGAASSQDVDYLDIYHHLGESLCLSPNSQPIYYLHTRTEGHFIIFHDNLQRLIHVLQLVSRFALPRAYI